MNNSMLLKQTGLCICLDHKFPDLWLVYSANPDQTDLRDCSRRLGAV